MNSFLGNKGLKRFKYAGFWRATDSCISLLIRVKLLPGIGKPLKLALIPVLLLKTWLDGSILFVTRVNPLFLPAINRLSMLKEIILTVLNVLYFPFRRAMTYQTFRYGACGAGNMLLDIFIYFLSYNFILQKEVLYTPIGAISPHIAAFLMAFVVSFPIGFFLNRYIVFPGSVVPGRSQLLRYFLLVFACIFLNYFFIKLFVEVFQIYPTVSKILTTAIVVAFSYFTQKHFTFKSQQGIKKAAPRRNGFFRHRYVLFYFLCSSCVVLYSTLRDIKTWVSHNIFNLPGIF